MKNRTKIFVLLLVLALFCGAFALMAGAEAEATEVPSGTLAEKWNAAEDGATLLLTGDDTYDGEALSLAEGKSLTLDLGGHTLTLGSTNDFLTSAGSLTVKNGTLAAGTKQVIVTTGGNLTLVDLTVTNTATDDAFPDTMVKVTSTTVSMTNTALSGKAKNILFIDASPLTADALTVQNKVLPISASSDRAAMYIQKDCNVTIENSLIEATYAGITFSSRTKDSTFTMENSSLNVTFRKDLTGDQLETSSYNLGDMRNFYSNKGSTTVIRLEDVKVYALGGKLFYGSGCDVTLKNCEIYAGAWARETTIHFEGINLFTNSAEPAYNSTTGGITFAEGARAYFNGDITAWTGVTVDDTGSEKENISGKYDGKYNRETYFKTSANYQIPNGMILPSYRVGQGTSFSVLYAHGAEAPTEEQVAQDLKAKIFAEVYNADGTLLYKRVSTSNLFTSPGAGGTIRLLQDVTVSPMASTIASYSTDINVDFNGHWLSLGGAEAVKKVAAFAISGCTAYFYTSCEGGGIRFLSANGGTSTMYSVTNGSKSYGSNVLFSVTSNGALHLGYNGQSEDDHSDKNFTVVSSVVADIGSGTVTVKGGRYYRMFGDNHAFFDLRSGKTDGNAVTLQNAYFYTDNAYSVVGAHDNNIRIGASIKNCILDNCGILSLAYVKNKQVTGLTGEITLTDCVLNKVPSAAEGVTITLGEGCYYMGNIAAGFFGTNTYDVRCDAHTVTVQRVGRLTPAQLKDGASMVTGTQTITAEKKVTESYVIVKDGVNETKWALGSTVSAGTAAYRDGGTYYEPTSLLLKSGDTVYEDGKIPQDLAAGAELTVEVQYDEKQIAFVVLTASAGETLYFYTNAASGGASLATALNALTEGATVTLYCDLEASENENTVNTKNAAKKTISLDLNGCTFTLKCTKKDSSGSDEHGTFWTTNGANVNIYSSKAGGKVKGPGGTCTFLSVNNGSMVTIGAHDTAPGSNLTAEDLIVANLWSNSVTINGGTYARTGGSFARLFELCSSSVMTIKNATLSVALSKATTDSIIIFGYNNDTARKIMLENCTVYTSKAASAALFSLRTKNTGLTCTITGGSYYGITLPATLANGATLTYNISGQPRFTAVADGAASDKTVVTIADTYLAGKTDSPVSCVLADSTEGTHAVTFTYGTESLTQHWFADSYPTFRKDAFGTYVWYAKADAPLTADTSYAAVLKTTSAKVMGNLTLYSNITFNLYIEKDGFITGITYGENSTIFTDEDVVTLGDKDYYTFKISDIAPKDLYKSFTVTLNLTDGYVYEVKTSLAKYAASVLANESESEEGKTLVLSLVNYVKETALKYGDALETHEGIAALNTLLTKNGYTTPAWTAQNVQDVTAGEKLLGAALNLDSKPGFVFFVGNDVTEVTVGYNGVTLTFSGEDIKQYDTEDGAKPGVLVDSLHASAFRTTMTVTAGGETLTYNLDTYIKGVTGEGESASAYLQALYAYSAAAEAYLAAQPND